MQPIVPIFADPCSALVVGVGCLFNVTQKGRCNLWGLCAYVSALRIQVSEHCKELLDQLGAYEFDDRGQVEVKVSRRPIITRQIEWTKSLCH